MANLGLKDIYYIIILFSMLQKMSNPQGEPEKVTEMVWDHFYRRCKSSADNPLHWCYKREGELFCIFLFDSQPDPYTFIDEEGINITSLQFKHAGTYSCGEQQFFILEVKGSSSESLVLSDGYHTFTCPKTQSLTSGEKYFWHKSQSLIPLPTSKGEGVTVWQNVTEDKSLTTLVVESELQEQHDYICQSSLHDFIWKLRISPVNNTPVRNPSTVTLSNPVTKPTTELPTGTYTSEEKPTTSSEENPSTVSSSKPTTDPPNEVIVPVASDSSGALIAAKIFALIVAVIGAVIYWKDKNGCKPATGSHNETQNKASNDSSPEVQALLITAPVENSDTHLDEITSEDGAIELRVNDQYRGFTKPINSGQIFCQNLDSGISEEQPEKRQGEGDPAHQLQESANADELTEVQIHCPNPDSGISEEQPEERQGDGEPGHQIQESANADELTEVQIHSQNPDSGISEEQPEDRQESGDILTESQLDTRLDLDVTLYSMHDTDETMRLAPELAEQAARKEENAEHILHATVTPKHLEELGEMFKTSVVPMKNALLVSIDWWDVSLEREKVTFDITCNDKSCSKECVTPDNLSVVPLKSDHITQLFQDLRQNHAYKVTTKVGRHETVEDSTTLDFDVDDD